ncbi:hypothetical protein ACQPZF_23745 [Actinosynnema sp. CS-041913]|uniref:hypothetical protein n=1 Tax=Actinosynnema sp. CS-041913 TaxID=3239917 RepID=UPI003D90304A
MPPTAGMAGSSFSNISGVADQGVGGASGALAASGGGPSPGAASLVISAGDDAKQLTSA